MAGQKWESAIRTSFGAHAVKVASLTSIYKKDEIIMAERGD